MDDAFIVVIEVSRKNPNWDLLKFYLKQEYFTINDEIRLEDKVIYEVVCDNFVDAAKIETYLQTCGL